MLLVSPHLCRAEDSFSAVALDPGGVAYAGVKRQPKVITLRSSLVSIRFNGCQGRNCRSDCQGKNCRSEMVTRKIRLPQAVVPREIIGLIPERTRLFVISQHVIESGDEPMIHLLDLKASRWQRLEGRLCVGLARVRFAGTRLTAECEEEQEGTTTKSTRSYSLKVPGFEQSGSIEIPQIKSRMGENEAVLQGDFFHWKTLELKLAGGKTKTFSAKELF